VGGSLQDYAIFLDLPLTFDSKVRLPRAPSRGAPSNTWLPSLLSPPSLLLPALLADIRTPYVEHNSRWYVPA